MTKNKTLLASALMTLLAASPAVAEGNAKNVLSSVDVNLSGWARVEYGIGEDRYLEENGDDHFGISKAALITEASVEDFTLTAKLGTTQMSDEDDSDIDFKELFVTWDHCDQLESIWGLQALNFGLKSAGYEGDRSIVPSLEFGGAGGVAVSNQVATGAKFVVGLAEGINLELAAFDTSESTAEFVEGSGLGNVDGSTLWDNLFGQIRINDAIIEGMYASAGLEGRYVGETDDTETISAIGAGFGTDQFDISAEWMSIAEEIAGTPDDEQYVIVELTVTPADKFELIFDWATSMEADVDTIRTGVGYNINDNVKAQVEYAGDMVDTEGAEDVDSVDARLTLSF